MKPLADSDQLIPPPCELRPALAEAMRRVRILRGLLKLSEKAAEMGPRKNEPKREAANASAR